MVANPMDLSSLMITLGSLGFTFLHTKMKHCIIRHCKKVQNEKDLTFINVRSDHGGEFENHGFETFCNEHGYVINIFGEKP